MRSFNIIQGNTLTALQNENSSCSERKEDAELLARSILAPPLCLNVEKGGCGGEGDNLIVSCTNCPVC